MASFARDSGVSFFLAKILNSFFAFSTGFSYFTFFCCDPPALLTLRINFMFDKFDVIGFFSINLKSFFIFL